MKIANKETMYRLWILKTIEQYGITKTVEMIDSMLDGEAIKGTLQNLIVNMFNLERK